MYVHVHTYVICSTWNNVKPVTYTLYFYNPHTVLNSCSQVFLYMYIVNSETKTWLFNSKMLNHLNSYMMITMMACLYHDVTGL